MKKYIIIVFLLLLGFTSCKDFLEVDSPSKSGEEYVFANTDEMNRALTAVYASLMSNDGYGSANMNDFALNSDVEFTAFSSVAPNVNGSDFKCFDGARNGSAVAKYWTALYQGIERANIFINGTLNSPSYNKNDAAVAQMLGEAKTLRAMFYHDLVVLFGDVPFTTENTYSLGTNLVIPIEERNKILEFCINDLKEASTKMKYANKLTEGVKRASKEFAQGLIARMAMTRGGFALYPDNNNPANTGTMRRQPDYLEYYKVARDYADSVIMSGTHSLNKPFRQVFIDECNYISNVNDDPIFEIPFLRNSSGNVGYIHGPTGEWTNNTTTGENVWGRSDPKVNLNAFYRYSFDREDKRLDYTVGMWYYNTAGVPQMRSDYYVHNNKWSKFWTEASLLNPTISPRSEGGTGIAYPYMRYAEILLIYAEAVNELEGGANGTNGAKAKDALRKVRERAFRGSASYTDKVDKYVASAAASKEDFFDAVANERKWEFGGENMRWKDLVRWNLYSKVVVESFMDYYTATLSAGGDSYDEPPFSSSKWSSLPVFMYWKRADNPKNTDVYPNKNLQIMELHNPYGFVTNPGTGWNQTSFYISWFNDGDIRGQILYSFRGYIRAGENANFEQIRVLYPNNLPPVRYILPYPQDAINRSGGKYKNYYGY